jgi:predicted esterase
MKPVRPCPKPLPTSPWNQAEVGLGAKVSGLEAEVIETETDCGPLTRRYLVRVPAGDASSSPVLIVLHDAGENAEEVQLPTRWWFDDLAQRERAVLVYANGSQSVLRTENAWVNAGVWQTDEGAHPAVDDSEYLRAVVEQLREKRGLAQSGEVFLAGYGSGAVMALSAALRHPERYAGVAAFLPSRSPRKEDLDGAPGKVPRASRLHSVFVALPDAPSSDASAIASEWMAALGSEPSANPRDAAAARDPAARLVARRRRGPAAPAALARSRSFSRARRGRSHHPQGVASTPLLSRWPWRRLGLLPPTEPLSQQVRAGARAGSGESTAVENPAGGAGGPYFSRETWFVCKPWIETAEGPGRGAGLFLGGSVEHQTNQLFRSS